MADTPTRNPILDGLKQGLVFGAAAAALILPPMGGGTLMAKSAARPLDTGVLAPAITPREPRHADFSGETASPMARRLADWIVDSGDNRQMSFVVIDKKDARVFVFHPDGSLKGATPVLLGAAAGDDSVAGIGKRPIAEVRPEERTTPAGRFLAEPGRNSGGEDVIWVDYEAAVSMHRLRPVAVHERRQERLDTPTPEDNRISYGCINVPPAFFEAVLQPTFHKRRGVVYVLPEVKSLEQVFSFYDVGQRAAVARL